MKSSTSLRLRPVHRMMIALLALVTALPFIGFAAGNADAAAPIKADMKANQHNVELTVHGGSLAVEDGGLVLRNSKKQVVERVALFVMDEQNTKFPVAATVNGNTATLTPNFKAGTKASPGLVQATKAAKVRDDRSPQTKRLERDNQALQVMNQEISAAMTISSIVGLGIGLVIGFAVGCGATIVLACLPGAIPAATVGGIIGTVLGGGSGAVFAVVKYFMTISQPVR